MKKSLLRTGALLLAVWMLLAVAGCASSDTREDKYGYDRPRDAWISECLILPSMRSLEELFGTLGESGLLSDYALDNNGKLSDEGTNYLVVLCYGIPGVDVLESYLRFVLVGEDGLLFDEECVDVGSPLHYGISIDHFDMSGTPDARLRILSKPGTMQGAVVIPFTVKDAIQGDLYAYCSLDGAKESIAHYYVDGAAQAQVGQGSASKDISVDYLKIGYLDEAAYNEGNFDEAALSTTTPTLGDTPCYMVLDLAFTPRKSNGGDLSLNCFVCLPDETGDSVMLEEAPTGHVDQKLENGMLKLSASYGIPKTLGEQKSVRMILRVKQQLLLDGMEIFLSSSRIGLTGTTYVQNVATWVNPTPVVEDIVEQAETGNHGWEIAVGCAASLLVMFAAFSLVKLIRDEKEKGKGPLILFGIICVITLPLFYGLLPLGNGAILGIEIGLILISAVLAAII